MTPDTQHSNDKAQRTLEPAFGASEDVVVFLAANENYVPYLSCVLQSILDNSSAGRTYDIVVLGRFISETSRRRLAAQLARDNFSLRFFDFGPIMDQFTNLYLHGHFRVETYFRLLIPEIVPWCSKALYLDSDLVVLRDVAELFDTDVEGFMVAATLDADTAGQYNGFDPTRKQFIDTVMKLVDPYSYFQAGVVLLNLDQFRARYTCAEMLSFAAQHQWPLLDQDVLNSLAQGHVRYVDMAWNTLMDWQGLRRKHIIALAPEHLRDAYDAARANPFIVHYAGPGNKPWECREVDMGEYFWHYADRCPYAQALRSHMKKASSSFEGRKRQVSDFWMYRLLLPAGSVVAPAGSPQRRAIYRAYQRFGG